MRGFDQHANRQGQGLEEAVTEAVIGVIRTRHSCEGRNPLIFLDSRIRGNDSDFGAVLSLMST